MIGHLTIPAATAFFERCAAALRLPDDADSSVTEQRHNSRQQPRRGRSVIVLKDNVSPTEESNFDDADSSFMRSREELLSIFRAAGLRVLAEERQTNMPKGLFPIYVFVLVPTEDD